MFYRTQAAGADERAHDGRVPRATPLGATVAFLVALAGPATASAFDVTAGCRDGRLHGAYELRSDRGSVRVIGAFNRGRRTGSFIFWDDQRVRTAHLPYEDDALSGTAALWHPPSRAGRAPHQRLEAAYAAGRPSGTTRTWHADGRRRSEVEFRDGALVAAQAWDARGAPLADADARAQAQRDEADAQARYRALQQLVADHPPPCAAEPDARIGR